MTKQEKIITLFEANKLLFDDKLSLAQTKQKYCSERTVDIELAVTLKAAMRMIKMLEKQNEILTNLKIR